MAFKFDAGGQLVTQHGACRVSGMLNLYYLILPKRSRLLQTYGRTTVSNPWKHFSIFCLLGLWNRRGACVIGSDVAANAKKLLVSNGSAPSLGLIGGSTRRANNCTLFKCRSQGSLSTSITPTGPHPSLLTGSVTRSLRTSSLACDKKIQHGIDANQIPSFLRLTISKLSLIKT